ncbi:MAG: hypothetical protein ACK5JF_14205 [Oscillospiraceae bacterium]
MQTIVIVLLVLVSVGYTAYTYFQNKETTSINTEGYLEATATITAVFPARITRYGAKQPRYDIKYKNEKGEEQTKFRCELGGGLAVNDTITILYDPNNKGADIVRKQ